MRLKIHRFRESHDAPSLYSAWTQPQQKVWTYHTCSGCECEVPPVSWCCAIMRKITRCLVPQSRTRAEREAWIVKGHWSNPERSLQGILSWPETRSSFTLCERSKANCNKWTRLCAFVMMFHSNSELILLNTKLILFDTTRVDSVKQSFSRFGEIQRIRLVRDQS